MHNLLFYFTQSLQRRLDMERADREKAENETLKLVNELQENNRKADGLRDLEMKLVPFPFHVYYIHSLIFDTFTFQKAFNYLAS